MEFVAEHLDNYLEDEFKITGKFHAVYTDRIARSNRAMAAVGVRRRGIPDGYDRLRESLKSEMEHEYKQNRSWLLLDHLSITLLELWGGESLTLIEKTAALCLLYTKDFKDDPDWNFLPILRTAIRKFMPKEEWFTSLYYPMIMLLIAQASRKTIEEVDAQDLPFTIRE